MQNLSPQQSEEAQQAQTKPGGRTPLLYFRLDAEGHLVITDHPSDLTLRVDADGELIASDDTAKGRGGFALVTDPAVLLYKAL
jgi:hypothetical protein